MQRFLLYFVIIIVMVQLEHFQRLALLPNRNTICIKVAQGMHTDTMTRRRDRL